MNMWECLGIEKTKDINRIKSAYAKLLRVHHPEDDPQGFQMLKSAYEYAQNYVHIVKSADAYKEELLLEMGFVRYCQQNSLDAEDEPDNGEWLTGVLEVYPDSTPTSPFKIQNDNCAKDRKLLEDFIVRMQTLYDDFFARCEIANWEKLLMHDLLWNIDSKDALEPMIQRFLAIHRNLPPEVWRIFDNEFHWNERIKELSSSNPPFVQIILVETCRRWALDYSFITEDSAIDYEKYIEFLRLTREAALENDVKRVKENFHKAIIIYNREPQIFEITCEFLTTQFYITTYGDYRTEYQLSLDNLIALHVNDYTYYLMRADFYKSCEDFENARTDYLQANKIFPENLNILIAIVISYQKQSMTEPAKSYLKYIRKIYPKTKINLEKQLETADDKEKIRSVMATNDKIIEDVRDVLKFRFDPYRYGFAILCISAFVILALAMLLMKLLDHS